MAPGDPLPASTDVVVLGAGPTGLTAALLLAAYGVDAVLVERHRCTTELPRAIAIDDEYMRLLSRLGLGEQLRSHTSVPFGIHFISPLGFETVRVPGFVTPIGFGNRNAVLQPVLEKLLLQKLRGSRHVKVCFGADVTALNASANSAALAVSIGDGVQRRIETRFLLACDGARSFVRQALDIPFDGRRIDEPHLVVDLAEFPDQSNFSRFFCNPSRPLNSVLGPYGGRRLEFMLMPGDNREWLLTDAGVRALVDRHSPYKGAELKIIRRAIYGFSERIARRLQQGRIYLLGDAAHVMPPFGGQGMNSGARDAANLVWKLYGYLQGTFNARMLATYEPERRPHVEAIVRYSVRVGKLANIRSWPLAILRDVGFWLLNRITPIRRYFSEMRYMPKPRLSAGFVDTRQDDPLVGRMLPLLRFRGADGGARTIDDLVGLSFALIAIDVVPDVLERAAATHPWSVLKPVLVSLTTAVGAEGVHPVGDLSTGIARERSGKIIVVRPDGYVTAVVDASGFVSLGRQLANYTSQSVMQNGLDEVSQ